MNHSRTPHLSRSAVFGRIATALLLLASAVMVMVTGGPQPAMADGPYSHQAPFWLATSEGDVWGLGQPTFGTLKDIPLQKPIVGITPTPTKLGYWLVASDGGIFAFGDAQFFGSTGAMKLNKPIVGMAATPTGKGYWLFAGDGGIFAFGDAQFFGSTGNLKLVKPVVAMTATPSNKGYYLVASDGGIFAFGDARFFGSTGAITLAQPIVGMASTNTGNGYWLAAADGGIFNYGDATFAGSGATTGDLTYTTVVAGADNQGYWLVRNGGDGIGFGSAATAARPVLGFMFKTFNKGDIAVKFAVSQLDKPYIWGGNGPVGYDCSGLTSAGWRAAGTSIPRVANDQYNFGQRIPLDQIRPGDLLYWGPDRADDRSIDHVAMYVGGGWAIESGGQSKPSRTYYRSVPKTSGWIFPYGTRPAV